jgi:hypothetical protein
MRLSQRSVPAIVKEHALGERRKIRKDEGQQILSVAQLLLHVTRKMFPMPVINGIHRSRRFGPVGVAIQGPVDAIVEGP